MPTGKGPLRIAIEDFYASFNFQKRIHDGTTAYIKMLEQEGYLVYKSIVTQFGVDKYLPAFLKPDTFKAQSPDKPVQLVAIVGLLLGVVGGIIAGTMQPITRLMSYIVDRIALSYRPDPNLLVAMIRRMQSKATELDGYLLDLGVNDTLKQGLFKVSQQYLSPLEYERLRLKEGIDFATYSAKLSELGVASDDVMHLQKLVKGIPGPSDLISMAVREAWNETTVTAFKLDEDLPAEFVQWMTKQGLDAEWSKRYWRAHWQLPSPQMGFEMLQRLRPGRATNVFTANDLNILLKAADYPDFYRKRLTEISYATLTRVDIRRMYGVGSLSKDGVYQAYLDLGYNDRDAKLLTDFTVRIEKAEEKGLTRSAIQDAYRRGVWTRNQALSSLKELGFDDVEADFWLDLVDVDLHNQKVDDKLAVIRAKYISDLLDDKTVYAEINPLGLPSDRVNDLIALWNVSKYNQVALPSRSELDDFLRREIISETDYKSRLKRLGYEEVVITFYVRRIDGIILEDKRIQQEQARNEKEQTDKQQRSTDYQKGVAAINVQLAEIDVTIADTKLAIYDADKPDDIAEMKRQILALNVSKKQLNVEKVNLRRSLTNK